MFLLCALKKNITMKINSANFIVLGNWNKKNFTPDWVKNNLFDNPNDIDFEGIVNFEDFDLGYSCNDLIIMPRENSLEISLKQFSVENITAATKLLIKIFNLLPHTPLKAIGFNLKFFAKNNEDNELINLSNKLFSSSLTLPLTQIKFTENKDTYLLNIIIDNFNEDLIINYNFHYNQILNLTENSFVEHFNETIKYSQENGN